MFNPVALNLYFILFPLLNLSLFFLVFDSLDSFFRAFLDFPFLRN